MNSLIKIAGFTYKNWIFAKRNFFSFVEILFWPVVSLLSIGLMAKFLDFKGDVRNFILTGVIASGVLQITQLDVSYSMLYDIWSKSSKHTFLAPISHAHYLIGSWLVGIFRGLLVYAALIIMAGVYFGFAAPQLLAMGIFLVGLYFQALLIGTMVCMLIIMFGQKVEVTAWSSVALLMLLCGIYYPVGYLPDSLQLIAQLIPLTYFLEYIRISYGFAPLFSWGLAKGFVLVIAYELIAVFLLSRAFHNSCRTGKVFNLSE